MSVPSGPDGPTAIAASPAIIFNAECLAEKLTYHRAVTRRLSLRKAAAEIGISPSTLSRLERCIKEPDILSLFLCCSWLGYKMEGLFTDQPAKPKS